MNKTILTALVLIFSMFAFNAAAAPVAKNAKKSKPKIDAPAPKPNLDPVPRSQTSNRSALPSWFYLDGTFGLGYAQNNAPSVINVSYASSPKMIQMLLGTTTGLKINNSLFAGLSFDYKKSFQISSVDKLIGNFSGTRWNLLSPTVGIYLNEYLLKLDFQYLGNYTMANKTVDGKDVSYGNVFGGRAVFMAPMDNFVKMPLNAGLLFEYLSFGRVMSDTFKNQKLTTRLGAWSLLLVANYSF